MSELTDGKKSGIKTVLEEEHRSSDPVPGTGATQANLPLCESEGAEDRAETDAQSRGPGRPKGSKNRNTEEWRKYLLSRYSSPLEGLLAEACKSEAELAQELGLRCAPNYEQALELRKIRLQCMKEALPYVHQKQPLAVEARGDGLMQLVINTGAFTQDQVEDAGEMKVDFIDAETVENQGVSAAENQELHAAELHAADQSIENNNKNQTSESD